jgi:hypothetical protein
MTSFPNFAFIDESGVLDNDPNQPFFALGLMLIEDTPEMTLELNNLKGQVLKAFPSLRKDFEFKFKNVTKGYQPFYENLIDVALSHPIKISVFVLDKTDPSIDVSKYFKTTWDAYISYSKLILKNNVKSKDTCIVIADQISKPGNQKKYLERELRSMTIVHNAMMLDSYASAFIQVVDVLTGCVIHDFRKKKHPRLAADKVKRSLSKYLAGKLGVASLATGFTVTKPIYFNVWRFKPR